MTSVATRSKKPILEKQPRATIYVRNYAKKAIMLTLPTRVSQQQLRQKIQRKMRVPCEEQALFLHGALVPNDLEQITLENKLIFHLVNLRRISTERVTIHVKRIEPDSYAFKYNVNPQMKIGDFMSNQFARDFVPAQYYFLVYTGRELQSSKTFLEELVEDQSEILAVHKVQNLKSEFIELRRHSAQQHSKSLKKEQESSNTSYKQKEDQSENIQQNPEQHKVEKVEQSNPQTQKLDLSPPPEKFDENEKAVQSNIQKMQNIEKENKKTAQIESLKGQEGKLDAHPENNQENNKLNQELEYKDTQQNTKLYLEVIIQKADNEERKEMEEGQQNYNQCLPNQNFQLQKIQQKESLNKIAHHQNQENPTQFEENEEQTEDIIIDKSQKYCMISSHSKGTENDHPRRSRSNSSVSEIKDHEKYQQNENQNSDSHAKQQYSAGNIGLTVISSRHEEQQSINNSHFKPIQRQRIQRDGLDQNQQRSPNAVQRAFSANIVIEKDESFIKEQKSQPNVPEDSQENEQKQNDDQTIIGALDDEVLDEQLKIQRKYEISLYDLLFGQIPQGNKHKEERILNLTETASIQQLKETNTQRESEDKCKQTEQKEQAELELESAQMGVTEAVIQTKDNGMAVEKKRSRNSQEYVKIMEERAFHENPFKVKDKSEEPVQIIDLKQDDTPVVFSNVFNPHYFQNTAPNRNKQQEENMQIQSQQCMHVGISAEAVQQEPQPSPLNIRTSEQYEETDLNGNKNQFIKDGNKQTNEDHNNIREEQ